MASPYPGPFCQELNLSSTKLLTHPDLIPQTLAIKNGLVYELYTLLQSNHLEWEAMKTWLLQLQAETAKVALGTLRYTVKKVVAMRTQLNKNKEKAQQLDAYLNEPFVIPVPKAHYSNGHHSAPCTSTSSAVSQQCAARNIKETGTRKTCARSFQRLEMDVLSNVNQSLATEAQTWKERYEQETQTNKKLQAKYDQLVHGRYNPHNVRRREARKQKQIKDQKKYIRQLERKFARKEVKRAKKCAAYFRSRCETLKKGLEMSECQSCIELEAQLKQLKEHNHDLLEYMQAYWMKSTSSNKK